MNISRRGFMKIGAATGAALAISKSGVLQSAEFAAGGKSVSVAGKEREKVPYTCLTCNIEDGGIAYLEEGRIVKLEGNPEHPGNRGKLCAKGNAGWQHVYDPDRLLHPLKRAGKRGENKWKRITWEDALNEVASKVQSAVDEDPSTVAFHFGRNRMHGAVERFMKAIGSNTIFNHTAVCESSKKVGMEHTWGPDIETPDFAHTNYILNFSNVCEAAYFHNPYAQRVAEGKGVNKAKMVTFDVRLSNSAGYSDEWIPVFPGTDGAIALAMCNVIMNEGLADEDFINKNCNVPASELKSHLSKYTPEMAEKESGVPAETIRRIAIEFASAGPATTYTYRGPCKHVNGAYNERCTMMLNIITGNIERRGGYNLPRGLGWVNGGGPEPVPPAPSAKSVLSSPPDYPLAAYKVCQILPYRIIDGAQKINVYFSYCHNPVFSQPDSETWKEMLLDEKLIPYHVATSFNMDETVMLADIILPDTTFLERWDPESMPSSYIGWVGLRQPVVKSPGGMPTREVLIELGKRIKQSRQYFDGVTAEGWVRNHFDTMPGLKEEGGFDYMKKHGVYKQKGVSEENFKFREGGKVS
ncbi:MAG: molybdopterin-dependent oxidoreductase, partial [Nitrospinae bacterium]|nr:molybdopterin-dependent oxidoreductase [Nitrospinota bacterium]